MEKCADKRSEKAICVSSNYILQVLLHLGIQVRLSIWAYLTLHANQGETNEKPRTYHAYMLICPDISVAFSELHFICIFIKSLCL